MSSTDGGSVAVVLDYLPHGRADDDRPRSQKPPLAYALGVENFRLYECVLEADADVSFGDRIDVHGDDVVTVSRVSFEDLSGGARSELEYAVEEIVDEDERRFADHYNEAQPITLRLHQLNLLPGIGKKLRDTILEERKRRPFESFEDLDERVAGLHDPRQIVIDRVLEELREDDLKYRSFVN
jgi:putative nucleotide binding protein